MTAGDDTAPPAEDRAIRAVLARELRWWAQQTAPLTTLTDDPFGNEASACRWRDARRLEARAEQLDPGGEWPRVDWARAVAGPPAVPTAGLRPGPTAPDDGQCRYCPNDVDRGEDGYLHCIECGWTDNPATVVHFRDEVDELRDAADAMRAAGDEIVEVVAYIVDRLGPGVCPASVAGAVERGIQATQRWRSAAGSPTTDGQAPTDDTAAPDRVTTDEVYRWHLGRFGQPDVLMVSGKLAEETGEVCGAIVKRAEGAVRPAKGLVTHDDWTRHLHDEIGDAGIVLNVLAGREGTTLDELVRRRFRDDVALRTGQEAPAGQPVRDSQDGGA